MSGSVTFEKITPDESWRVFDEAARRYFNMGADELVKRWDAGELADQTSPELMRVLMLRPSGR
jgi:hypothetical protein